MSEVFPLKEIPLPVKVYPLKQPRLYKLHSQYPAITIYIQLSVLPAQTVMVFR